MQQPTIMQLHDWICRAGADKTAPMRHFTIDSAIRGGRIIGPVSCF
jgi:hypothetical protein